MTINIVIPAVVRTPPFYWTCPYYLLRKSWFPGKASSCHSGESRNPVHKQTQD